MQSSKILLKDGQIVDLVDGRINDGDIDTWNNKLNVEITSEDNSVKVNETTDVQTNTKNVDISVNTGIIATKGEVSGLESLINHKLDSKEDVSNKIQVVNDSSTTEYPSSKAVADFVNSSVATNTATFLGNFSLEDLGLTYPATEVQIASALNSHTWPTGYPTNNDYVYVEISNPQSSIYDKVQRYKYRGSVASWGYEYTLNNSSFTAEEMAAIDSGITSQDVTNLRVDHTTLESHVSNTSNPHKVTKSQVGLGNVDNTRDADKPVSTAQQNALNKKLDKTGDASNTTATFTKNSGDTSSVTSGSKLSTMFTAISNFFASLKALAFKDKVSDSDISGTVSDSHIASASTWNGKASSTHTHGNIQNGGTLQTNDITIDNGDKLVVTDASDSSKVARASLTFDGATTNKMLSKKGEWSDTIAKARAVVDYGSLSRAIEIGWGGASVTSATHFAVYTDSENGYNKAIKDCQLETVKKLINGTSVGSPAVPVYINGTGTPQVCTDDFVHDANYVHTDNNFTNTDKSKLDNIQAGAEQNVQSDWNQTDSSADNYIKNKPSIPTKDSDLTNDRYVSFDANNQGLTDAQMSNARTNIGAGTSNLELGETAFTAAYGNHQHGRLQNNGSLGDENWEVSSGDSIVIAKAEFNGKRGYLAPSAITFDSNEDSKALTQSAQWKEFLPPNGDGSSVSVTPDGTSTGYDLGSGTTLKVLAQKFKNLVNALKSLAFKDKVTDSDISGTISDSHIASASTWSGKQSALDTQTAYSARGSATKVPQITTNSLGQVTGISEVTISGVTPSSHASTGTTYGVGTTSNYGHVKLLNGDLNGKSYTDGVAAASDHTHGQYLTSHQSITTGSRNGSIGVSGRDVDVKGLGRLAYKSTIDTDDVSSGRYSIDISGNSATASSAYRPLPYYTYIGEITNSKARHWQILKRTLSRSGDCINAVITVFIQSGKDTFLAYNVSFLIYRSGNSFTGKVFKTNIGNGDNSMSVTFNLIKTPDSNEVSVIASMAASTTSSLYINGYATATLVEWADFVTKNNTGNTIADIVGPGYSNIASA